MMKTKKVCADCNEQLSKDEVALSKKMLGREVSDFYCIDCLAEFLVCDEDDLVVKIEEFKEQGCTLFL